MIKRIILLLCTIVIICIILYINIAPAQPVLKLGDEYDTFVNEDAFKKYDIKLIRVKKDYENIVDYYLQVNSDYYVIIDDIKYQNLEPIKLDINDRFENKYLDIYILMIIIEKLMISKYIILAIIRNYNIYHGLSLMHQIFIILSLEL